MKETLSVNRQCMNDSRNQRKNLRKTRERTVLKIAHPQ